MKPKRKTRWRKTWIMTYRRRQIDTEVNDVTTRREQENQRDGER